MPLQLPQVPNFQTNIPQADPLQTYGKMLQLKSLQAQQQLIPGQLQQQQQDIQAKQTANELQQLQLQTQKGVAAYWSDPSKYDTDPGDSQHNDAIANMLGISPTDPLMAHVRGMLKAGAGPAALVEAQNTLQVRQEWSKATQEQQAVLKNAFEQLREIAAPVMNEHDATKKQALLDSALPGLQRWASFDPSLAQVIPQLHAGNFDAFANRVGAEEKALGLTQKQAEIEKTGTEAAAAAQKVIPPGAAMSPYQQAEANKEVQVAGREQPLKLQEATAKAKAEQLIKGLTEPGYAFNPKTGETVLTDQTAYLQSGGGLQAFRKVGEKDVRDDTMMTNRLGDVHQKLAEYEQALQKPITDKEKGNIAGLLGATGVKLGAFGTEIPMDRVNAALNAENLKGLSANARDQLVAYRNMREALLGYKTVLSGSARGSDKQMELLDQAIPIPSVTDQDYSKRALDSFKGNLHVVGQGLPTLPGVKNPQQIEQDVWGKQAKQGPPSGATHIVLGPDNKKHYTNAAGTVDYGIAP